MTETQRLRELVQAQERTIEALTARLYQERIDHGHAMRRAMKAKAHREWMVRQAQEAQP